MFKFIKDVLSKKSEESYQEALPSIMFELQPDDTIRISAYWPTVNNEHEAVSLVQRYSTMLNLINSGKLNQTMMRAVAIYGGDDHIGNQLARGIISFSQSLNEDSLDEPVVPPTRAFGVRTNQDD
jgi:hypothetical protein